MSNCKSAAAGRILQGYAQKRSAEVSQYKYGGRDS